MEERKLGCSDNESILTMTVLQEAHDRAWRKVADYMQGNLRLFHTTSRDMESTVLPALQTHVRWLGSSLQDLCYMKLTP